MFLFSCFPKTVIFSIATKRVEHVKILHFSPAVFTWFCCKHLFLFYRKKMSSFTKPCNVLSMFLNFEPWKPYVLISFVLIKKKLVINAKRYLNDVIQLRSSVFTVNFEHIPQFLLWYSLFTFSR